MFKKYWNNKDTEIISFYLLQFSRNLEDVSLFISVNIHFEVKQL